MEKLFAALRDRHSGYGVIDFRLLANIQEADGQDADELDEQFAEAVRVADGPIALDVVTSTK